MPVRKRTSDNGMQVRGIGGWICTVMSFQGAGFLMVCSPAVAADAPQRGHRRQTGATLDFGPGSGAGPSRVCTRRPAPFGGSLLSASILGRKAGKPVQGPVPLLLPGRDSAVPAPVQGKFPWAACHSTSNQNRLRVPAAVSPTVPL